MHEVRLARLALSEVAPLWNWSGGAGVVPDSRFPHFSACSQTVCDVFFQSQCFLLGEALAFDFLVAAARLRRHVHVGCKVLEAWLERDKDGCRLLKTDLARRMLATGFARRAQGKGIDVNMFMKLGGFAGACQEGSTDGQILERRCESVVHRKRGKMLPACPKTA